MTPDQIALAAHQLGMHMAMKEIDTPAGLDRWRRHNLARRVCARSRLCLPAGMRSRTRRS
jgi:hypothetical protein